jgi:flavodoxin
MKKTYVILLIITASIIFMGAPAFSNGDSETQNKGKAGEDDLLPSSATLKILVVYFSKTGNTREIANQIHTLVGGNIFEIQTVKTYPDDYEELKTMAKEELASEFKPALKTKIENIRSYDLVFIGYPIWWGTFPAPVRTFLSEYDLSEKNIIPFCTHLGSGLGQSITDISKLCPVSTLLEGIAIWGKDVKNTQNGVSTWLRKINILK